MTSSEKLHEILYFFYGANMNIENICTHCRNTKPVAIARLRDHRLAFFGHSEKWDGGEETVVRQPGEDVFGVIYRLSFSDSDRLDAYQGVRLNGTGSYFHFPAEVIGEDGNIYSVLLYKKTILMEPQKPSMEYLAHIISGAVSHTLPPSYIDRLRAIETMAVGYRVPLQDNVDVLSMSSHSCHFG